MHKTMYDVNWHYIDIFNNSGFTHCSVTPIKVIREDVLPGCSAVSITAIGHEGRRFHGCPEYYFNTEREAWDDVKQCLQHTIEQLEKEITEKQHNVDNMKKFLSTIN